MIPKYNEITSSMFVSQKYISLLATMGLYLDGTNEDRHDRKNRKERKMWQLCAAKVFFAQYTHEMRDCDSIVYSHWLEISFSSDIIST